MNNCLGAYGRLEVIVTLLENGRRFARETRTLELFRGIYTYGIHLGLYIWNPALYWFSQIHWVRAWPWTLRHVWLPRGRRSSTGSTIRTLWSGFSKLTWNRGLSVLLLVWGENTGTGNCREPDDQVMLLYRLPFHGVMVGSNHRLIDFKGGGRQPSLQPLLQKGQHDSDRAFPGVFSMRRAPLDEQVPFQGISVSCRLCSRRSDGVNYLSG